MIGVSLLVLAWSHGASLQASPLTLHEPAPSSAWVLDAGLRVDRFGFDGRRRALPRGLAQAAQQADRDAAAAESAGPAAESSGSGEAAAEACDIDCETCRDDDRLARYVTRNRGRTLRTHRAFAIAAWSTMLVTEVLGTIQMVNQPTWFGDGACSSDPDAFGCRRSSAITALHETFAFTTTALYTTAGVLAIAAPDPENASEGDGQAERTLRLHKVFAYIHGGGMILLPILGILSAHPQILGINQDAQGDFSRAMRTVHGIVGFTTFAALTFSGYLELF